MSGEAAEAIEKQPAGEAVAQALAVLRSIFQPQGITVPTPLQVLSPALLLPSSTSINTCLSCCAFQALQYTIIQMQRSAFSFDSTEGIAGLKLLPLLGQYKLDRIDFETLLIYEQLDCMTYKCKR